MDGQTERCAHCGTPSLEGGRFCTNCGAQLGTEPTNPRIFPSVADTAERVYDVPAPAYAASSSLPPPPTAAPGPPPGSTAASAPVYLVPGSVGRRPGPGLWVGAAAALLSVLVIGGFLLLHGSSGGGLRSR